MDSRGVEDTSAGKASLVPRKIGRNALKLNTQWDPYWKRPFDMLPRCKHYAGGMCKGGPFD